MSIFKPLLTSMLFCSSLLANNYYTLNENVPHCSCELLHYCVQLGVYEKKENIEKAKKALKDDTSIVLLSEEKVKIANKIHHRLIAHSDHFYVSKEEAQILLKTLNKKYHKHFPKAFIIKRYIMD